MILAPSRHIALFDNPLAALMAHLKKGASGHLLKTATGHLSKGCGGGPAPPGHCCRRWRNVSVQISGTTTCSQCVGPGIWYRSEGTANGSWQLQGLHPEFGCHATDYGGLIHIDTTGECVDHPSTSPSWLVQASNNDVFGRINDTQIGVGHIFVQLFGGPGGTLGFSSPNLGPHVFDIDDNEGDQIIFPNHGDTCAPPWSSQRPGTEGGQALVKWKWCCRQTCADCCDRYKITVVGGSAAGDYFVDGGGSLCVWQGDGATIKCAVGMFWMARVSSGLKAIRSSGFGDCPVSGTWEIIHNTVGATSVSVTCVGGSFAEGGAGEEDI